MNILIIGLGSIAKKHIAALKQIDLEAKFYALRSSNNSNQFEDVINITEINSILKFDFVIISNPTAFHSEAIQIAAKLNIPLFIEKPPFHKLVDAEICLSLIAKYNLITYTAFNLRFLDCLKFLKKNIKISKVQEVNVYCGSYLPEWRTNIDYKKNYSANELMGGGVHLDLIHEMDYVLWLFGNPIEVRKILRSKSKIDINSIDYTNYALVYDGFVVNIVLNYFRRDPKRTCEIVFDDTTWNVNLMTNTIIDLKDNSNVFQSAQTVINTYKNQMEYFCNCISQNQVPFNSLVESVNTLKTALA